MDIEKQIQQWANVDNQINTLNDKLKELRDVKMTLTENITTYVNEHNLTNNVIKSNDIGLKFSTTKTPEPLTFKFLEKSLAEIIKNEEQVKQIIDYLKKRRETKETQVIKRFSIN